MQAGKLRHRVKIHKQVSIRSKTGAVTKNWQHELTLWSSFEPLSVKDAINAQAEGSNITARCVLRYRDDIDSSMRVEHLGKMYEINGEPLADTNSGKEYMTLMLRRINHV